ncbi:MAG: AAA family ATPase [Planctomycetaceae bacterium]|jgi:AAA15 family ATPase/GTPase|nr:AAA family ATPase [Planctomycetaceae bacterium]
MEHSINPNHSETQRKLDSLEIKNFRCLKDFKIPSLKRINLFTGKNNTGKSTILEAIAIYATKGDLRLIMQLLDERGENIKPKQAEDYLKIFSSLFTDRIFGLGSEDVISIGSIEKITSEENKPSSHSNSVILEFVEFVNTIEKNEQGFVTGKKQFVQNGENGIKEVYKYGFAIGNGINSEVFSFDEAERFLRYYFGFNNGNLQYVRGRNIDSKNNSKLFDNIALTDKEQNVIDSLKIIEPATERITFVEEGRDERVAIIKLSDSQRLPLKSMGDGINRVLTMILALVNSDNGFLLVDEFENGLHYTIQEQLWNIIFLMSQRLNVQVFATTHSEDCIRAFESVLNSSGNTQAGKLIRLDNKNGKIIPVEFDAKDLEITNRNDIEIR